MILLKNFINIFYIAELRRKLVFTLGVLIVNSLGNHIPVIGIDVDKLANLMERGTGLGGLFSYLDLFSGGSLSQGMLFALGISPYITASIVMQMLTLSVPALEQMQKEGEYGRKLINQYTRYLALGVAVMQSFGIALLVEKYELVLQPGWSFRLMFMLALTVGSMFVMWLGEQISLHGIGNGSSMIIFAGIVARFPTDIIKTLGAVQQGYVDPLVAVVLLALFIGIAASIVFLEKGERKIPVQYTRRIVGTRVYGGQSTYIPFKINSAGVMPVIFAGALINIPIFLSTLLASRWEFFKGFAAMLERGGILYSSLDFLLIIAMSFLYTTLIFNPEELAENLKKSGAFIPGIRPGRKTAEFFYYLLTRIGLVGAVYLGLLAVLPTAIHALLLSNTLYLSVFSGTALLIMVGVALDTAAQIEAYLIEHRYEGFLVSGRLRGRR